MELYESLQSAKGVLVEDIVFPRSWNHLKGEYVALVTGKDDKFGLRRDFISSRKNLTSSRLNADLVLNVNLKDLPVGTILEVKDGSHKNLSQKIYRKDSDGWKKIAVREGKSAYFGGGWMKEWKFF